MKKTIIGVRPVDYISKKTGEPVIGVSLFLTSTSADTFGLVASDIFISASKPCYAASIKPFEKKINDLLGTECNVDYNEKGYLDNFTLEV